MRKIILKHAILYSLSIPSVAAKVDSLIRYESDLYAEIANENVPRQHRKPHELSKYPHPRRGCSGLFPAQTGSNRALDRAQVKLEAYACSIIRAHWYV